MACKTWTRYIKTRLNSTARGLYARPVGTKYHFVPIWSAKEYPIEPLEAVSTIGAGDNFNAGLIYGLLKYDVRYRDLNNLNEEVWDKVVQCGKDFAAEVCRSFSNSVSVEFARQYASK